jgi:hypothetical protein
MNREIDAPSGTRRAGLGEEAGLSFFDEPVCAEAVFAGKKTENVIQLVKGVC